MKKQLNPLPWKFCGAESMAELRDANGRSLAFPVGHDTAALERAADCVNLVPELVKALQELLTYANRYSDEMATIGRGAAELGALADSVSVAGMARSAIARGIKASGFPVSGPTHADVAEDEGEPRWVAHAREAIAQPANVYSPIVG